MPEWLPTAAFVGGLVLGWAFSTAHLVVLVRHWREDSRHWYRMWRKADETITEFCLNLPEPRPEPAPRPVGLPALDRILADAFDQDRPEAGN